MKRATVRLVGGLGNQLFGYAFALALQKAQNIDVELDCDSGFWFDAHQRVCLIDEFPNARFKRRHLPDTPFMRKAIFSGLIGLTRLSSFMPAVLKPVMSEGKPPRYRANALHFSPIWNGWFLGYWQSERYFKSAADAVREHLSPPRPTAPEALDIAARIEASHSCSIHWRSYSELANAASRPNMRVYYRTAIDRMRQRNPELRFFLFSDRQDLARQEFADLEHLIEFVDLPSSVGNAQSLIDFYLMYRCRHAIIGDSSFSWWAAWLGRPDHKTVIAPNDLTSWGEDWVASGWDGVGVQ